MHLVVMCVLEHRSSGLFDCHVCIVLLSWIGVYVHNVYTFTASQYHSVNVVKIVIFIVNIDGASPNR
jgi:hypothetical protein